MAKIESGKGPGILDDPEAALDDTLGRSEEFVRKNRKIIFGLLALIVVGVVGYFYYNYRLTESNKEAQAEMFGAVYYFESDSLKKALNGDGKDMGFLDIADEYPSTKAGKLANFYIGIIYLKQGKFGDAEEYLKKFDSDDLLLQARSYCLVGDANMEQKDANDAIEYYKKASEYYPNEYFTPRYLMKLAMAYVVTKDYKSAIGEYDKVINKYYKSAEANDAKKLKAEAEEKSK